MFKNLMSKLILTHSSLKVHLVIVFWVYDSFEDNFRIKNYFYKIFEGE